MMTQFSGNLWSFQVEPLEDKQSLSLLFLFAIAITIAIKVSEILDQLCTFHLSFLVPSFHPLFHSCRIPH